MGDKPDHKTNERHGQVKCHVTPRTNEETTEEKEPDKFQRRPPRNYDQENLTPENSESEPGRTRTRTFSESKQQRQQDSQKNPKGSATKTTAASSFTSRHRYRDYRRRSSSDISTRILGCVFFSCQGRPSYTVTRIRLRLPRLMLRTGKS